MSLLYSDPLNELISLDLVCQIEVFACKIEFLFAGENVFYGSVVQNQLRRGGCI